MADGYQELTVESLGTTDGISNLSRMINELYNNMGGDGQNVRIFNGYGTPEGVVTAGIGSLYLRKDGTTDTTLYRKESGTEGTGWVAVANFSVPVSIANGGTGQTTAQAAIDALLPSQTGNSGKFLTTNGTTSSWVSNSQIPILRYTGSSAGTLLTSLDTERSFTAGSRSTYITLKMIPLMYHVGELFVSYDYKSNTADDIVKLGLYLNGVVVGSEITTKDNWTTVTQSVSGINPGDNLSLRCWIGGGYGTDIISFRNFRLYYNTVTSTVTIDQSV